MKFNTIIKEYLGVSNEIIIDKIYEKWENKKDNELYSKERFFNNQDDILKLPEWLADYFKKYNIVPLALGVDLPYCVKNPDSALKIAVFGINPLRSESDWKFNFKPNESFILSSAWGKHFGYVQKQNIELFKRLESEFTLYLSDIQKWYFKHNGISSEKIPCFNKLCKHMEIVDKELNNFKPDFILLFGNQACKYFNIKIYGLTKNKIEIFEKDSRKFIVIPHTSNAVRENMKKQFAEKNGFLHNRKTLGKDYANLIIETIKNNIH